MKKLVIANKIVADSGSHIYQLQIKEEKLGNTSFHGLALGSK
jgi:hypothetical protein